MIIEQFSQELARCIKSGDIFPVPDFCERGKGSQITYFYRLYFPIKNHDSFWLQTSLTHYNYY